MDEKIHAVSSAADNLTVLWGSFFYLLECTLFVIRRDHGQRPTIEYCRAFPSKYAGNCCAVMPSSFSAPLRTCSPNAFFSKFVVIMEHSAMALDACFPAFLSHKASWVWHLAFFKKHVLGGGQTLERGYASLKKKFHD